MSKIKLKGNRFSIERVGDGAGDAGGELKSINTKTGKTVGKNGEIHLGCVIMCGSIYARSYQEQDFWMTTPVTEILSVNDDASIVKFKTKNSVYIAKGF